MGGERGEGGEMAISARVNWLVGIGFNGSFEIVFQSISGRLPNAMRNPGQEK